MPPKPKASYLRCTVGFVLPDRTVVKAGQVVAADDRVVAAAPNCFEPMGERAAAAAQAQPRVCRDVRRGEAQYPAGRAEGHRGDPGRG
jgi:hypothetical protein